MLGQFDGEEWIRLTSQERIRRCLFYAHEASELGVQAQPEAKQAYVHLSQQWLALAMEIEKTAGTG
jgi:hypothetical protein